MTLKVLMQVKNYAASYVYCLMRTAVGRDWSQSIHYDKLYCW
jgi:hypothetical protein